MSAPPVSDLTAPEGRQALAIRGGLTLWLFLRFAQEGVASLWAMVSGKRDLPTCH